MSGKAVGIVLILCATVAGAVLYYLQIYGFYRAVADDGAAVTLVSTETGAPESLRYADFSAIDADSSPIRYRACFTTDVPLATLKNAYVAMSDQAPRNAPNWFDCFDAETIAAELASGTAATFLGHKNIAYGVDRIVAVTRDGRGFVWHELNGCGEKAFDGTVIGEDCPERPETGPNQWSSLCQNC